MFCQSFHIVVFQECKVYALDVLPTSTLGLRVGWLVEYEGVEARHVEEEGVEARLLEDECVEARRARLTLIIY